MAIIKDPRSHEDLVNELISCATSIIKNADSIIGTEEKLADLTVHIYMHPGEPARINVDRDFYPEDINDLYSR